MGMIITHGDQKIAVGLRQVKTHDCGGRGDVEAGVVDQAVRDRTRRHARMLRQRLYPYRIDLHHPQIDRSIFVYMNQTGTPALDRLDRRQHPRRQVIERGCGRHARQERYAHGMTGAWLAAAAVWWINAMAPRRREET